MEIAPILGECSLLIALIVLCIVLRTVQNYEIAIDIFWMRKLVELLEQHFALSLMPTYAYTVNMLRV